MLATEWTLLSGGTQQGGWLISSGWWRWGYSEKCFKRLEGLGSPLPLASPIDPDFPCQSSTLSWPCCTPMKPSKFINASAGLIQLAWNTNFWTCSFKLSQASSYWDHIRTNFELMPIGKASGMELLFSYIGYPNELRGNHLTLWSQPFSSLLNCFMVATTGSSQTLALVKSLPGDHKKHIVTFYQGC